MGKNYNGNWYEETNQTAELGSLSSSASFYDQIPCIFLLCYPLSTNIHKHYVLSKPLLVLEWMILFSNIFLLQMSNKLLQTRCNTFPAKLMPPSKSCKDLVM